MIFTKNTYNDNGLYSLYAPNIFIGWEGTYLSPMEAGATPRWYSNLGDVTYGWVPYNDGNQFIKHGSDAQGAKCAMFTGNDTYVNPGDAVFLRFGFWVFEKIWRLLREKEIKYFCSGGSFRGQR